MKQRFKAGDIKEFKTIVQPGDIASFQGALVHNVYSTFALARDVEWSTRQFVLEMKDEDEEGIGTYLEIEHKSPAFVGEEIIVKGKFESLEGNALRCSFEVTVDNRVVATGWTGQKILKLEKIRSIFNHG